MKKHGIGKRLNLYFHLMDVFWLLSINDAFVLHFFILLTTNFQSLKYNLN
jgi:hypothetical protein